jgi:ribosomal protein S1
MEGQRVQVRVLHVDANKQRLGLSLIIGPQV